jgi:hypothetical protein
VKRAKGAIRRAAAVLIVLLIGSMIASPVIGASSPEGSGGDGILSYYSTSFGQSDSGYVVVQYWSKGSRFRSQAIIAGHPITTIVNGEWYYTLDTLSGVGLAIRRSKAAMAKDKGRLRPFATEYDDMVERGGEKIRSETLNGGPVDVYQLTDDLGRRTLWATQGVNRLPLRVESYERRTGRTGRLDYVTWLPNLAISDGFFLPPPNIQITRFESYQEYLDALRKAPVPPAPPLFGYLLHVKE